MRHIVHITGLWHHRLKTVKLFLEPICVRFRVAKSPFLGAQFSVYLRSDSALLLPFLTKSQIHTLEELFFYANETQQRDIRDILRIFGEGK